MFFGCGRIAKLEKVETIGRASSLWMANCWMSCRPEECGLPRKSTGKSCSILPCVLNCIGTQKTKTTWHPFELPGRSLSCRFHTMRLPWRSQRTKKTQSSATSSENGDFPRSVVPPDWNTCRMLSSPSVISRPTGCFPGFSNIGFFFIPMKNYLVQAHYYWQSFLVWSSICWWSHLFSCLVHKPLGISF